MTGRDLIIYILQNKLEDEPVFKDGKFIGYLTPGEAAEKLGVGEATIYAWVALGMLEGAAVTDKVYIPASAKPQSEGDKCTKYIEI